MVHIFSQELFNFNNLDQYVIEFTDINKIVYDVKGALIYGGPRRRTEDIIGKVTDVEASDGVIYIEGIIDDEAAIQKIEKMDYKISPTTITHSERRDREYVDSVEFLYLSPNGIKYIGKTKIEGERELEFERKS